MGNVRKRKDVYVKLVFQEKNVIFLNLIVLIVDQNVVERDFVIGNQENVDVEKDLEVMNAKLLNLVA